MAIHPKAEETIIRIEENSPKKFKQFDVIAGDHYYHSSLSSPASDDNPSQLSSETISLIMKEWSILKDSLPESIFVRAYEGRIDILRAVIIGPPGTPHHEGLFFYDIQITSGYPYTPPKFMLIFPSSLDPNDTHTACRRVRPLKNEKGKYSILEILLLHQSHIINAKPKPVLDYKSDLPTYCENLLEKEYKTFRLICLMMLEILKKPPEHFEEFVVEHFRDRAVSILTACKSYIGDGESKVVEDVNKNNKQCVAIKEERERYQESMRKIYRRLIKAFMENGSTNSLEDYIGDINMNEGYHGTTSCSAVFLFFFFESLVLLLLILGIRRFFTMPHDDYVLMLTMTLGMGFCSGLAFIFLKFTGYDFSVDSGGYS